MNWIELLNRATGRILVGNTIIEARSWAYSSHLADNVPHRHTYFEVCLVGAWGKGEYCVENVPYALTPGTLFIARPGVLHQIINREHPLMELYWVCFQWNGSTRQGEMENLLEAFARSSVLTVQDENGKLQMLWQALRLTAESAVQNNQQELGSVTQIRALMSALLIGIAQYGSDPPLSQVATTESDSAGSVVRQAVRYIHNNLHRPVSVFELAQETGFSERQITRLFVQFSGTSPAAYITQARIDRAGVLLLKTDDPIKQIASLLGYEDIHHFTRVFSRVMGCPPGQFRQQGGAFPPRVASAETVGKLVW